MKKSDIEKQLKSDLSASAPADFASVWNKCTTAKAENESPTGELAPVTGRTHTVSHGRKYVVLTAVLALVCCIGIIVFGIIAGVKSDFVLPSTSGYIVIDVNPSLQVNYNSQGKVTSAQGFNEDGEQLLNGLRLDGKTYDFAIGEIFDACVEQNYFSDDRDDNAILVTACKGGGEKDEKMTAEINSIIARKFADKRMKGIVISDVDNQKGKDEAEKYGINGQKYELIKRYIEMGGSLDDTQYESIKISELYLMIKELDKDKGK